MTRSQHSQKRINQRGFSEDMLDLALKYGRTQKAADGATKIFFGKKEVSLLLQKYKKIIQLCDKANGATLIIKDDNLITVYKNR